MHADSTASQKVAKCVTGFAILMCMYRFECLHLKCLSEPILNKYCEVLNKFSNEIDKIQKVELGCLATK